MTRISRPLDPAATKAADEDVYSNHENDPRPNALYESDGTRRGISATDDSQDAVRNEWRAAYVQALPTTPETAGSQHRPAPLHADTPVASSVTRCAQTHRIDVKLKAVALHEPKPWWSRKEPNYDSVHYKMAGASGAQEDRLDAAGNAAYTMIPAGSCSVVFDTFYADIEKALKQTPT